MYLNTQKMHIDLFISLPWITLPDTRSQRVRMVLKGTPNTIHVASSALFQPNTATSPGEVSDYR